MLKIGDTFIVNYDTDFDYEGAAEDDQPNPNCWAVLIPHLDPGFASYGSGSTTMMRLMFLTWARTILLLESCLELLYTRDGLRPGTREFAEAMVDLLQRKEGATDLSQRLADAQKSVFSQESSDASGE